MTHYGRSYEKKPVRLSILITPPCRTRAVLEDVATLVRGDAEDLASRVISDCHFAVQLNRFIYQLAYRVQ